MCSELFRIPLHWLSEPLVGGITGSVVVIALLLLGVVVVVARSKQQGKPVDIWGFLPGVVLFSAVAFFLPRMFADGLPIRGYGVMVLLGSVSGIALAIYRAKQRGLDPDVIMSLAFGMFLCGILGARLFFVIEYWETRFRADTWKETLLEVVKFTEGGLVIYGAFIGATLYFIWFTQQKKISTLAMADLIAPSLLVGLSLGRIGCLLNGCCYGGESDEAWAVTFPRESMLYSEQVITGRMHGFEVAWADEDSLPVVVRVQDGSPAEAAGLHVGTQITRINGEKITDLADAIYFAYGDQKPLKVETTSGEIIEIPAPEPRSRSLPVHPTQIYSAVNAALLAWVLWSFYPFRTRDGEVTALMLTTYPIARFLLEIIRIDESAVFGTGLSISQNISVVLFVLALCLWFFLRQRAPGVSGFAPETAQQV